MRVRDGGRRWRFGRRGVGAAGVGAAAVPRQVRLQRRAQRRPAAASRRPVPPLGRARRCSRQPVPLECTFFRI